MSNLDEFKDFVRRHPLLKQEVILKKKTWQEIYEDYVILKDDSMWDKYKYQETSSNDKEKSEPVKETKDDTLKTILSMAKKINPDTVTKYVSSIQKIIELFGSFGAGATAKEAVSKAKGMFDEWY